MKKLFSIMATVALVLGMFPAVNANAAYSAELEDAYGYAFNMGITTQSSIENADMYGTLTRVALAKMISNYVLELGLQTADTSAKCEFTDVSEALDTQYANGVTNACQLGLMGVGIEKFRPFDTVTRAEFGTVLSRAIWGDANNGSDPYYVAHLNALKDEGVMNDISNPNAKEVRGYVMLMMQRADENGVASGKPAICSTPENILACSLDLDSCPAECTADEEEVVLPGLISVSRVGSTETRSVPYNASLVKVGTVKLVAGPNGARVQSLAVTRSGLGEAADIEVTNGIRAAANGVIISSDADFYNNISQIGNVYFSPALDLKANESKEVEILVTLKSAAKENSEHSFAVTAVSLSNGTASGLPVSLSTLRTTSYKVSTADVDLLNAAAALEPGKANQSVVDFRVAAGTASLNLKSFAIARDTAGVDFTKRLSNAKVYHNGESVGNVRITADKIIVEGLSQTVADGSSKTYELKADVLVNSDAANLNLKLNESDVIAFEVETNHNVRINDLGAAPSIGFGAVFVTFTKKSTGNETVAPGTSNIKLFDGEVKSSTNMFVRELRINSDAANGALSSFTNNQLNVKVNGATVATLVHPVAAGSDTDVSVSFALEANTPVRVTIEGTARDTAAGNYKYTVSLRDVRDASNNAVAVGASAFRAGDTTTISAGTIAAKLATVAAPSSSSVYSNASDLEIGRFALEAKAERLTVRKITATQTAASTLAADLDDAISSVKLVNIATNQEVNASVTINAGDIVFDSMSIAVEKDQIANFKIVAQTNNLSANNTETLSFDVVVNTANRQSGGVVAGITDAVTKLYTVGVRPPEVTGTKLAVDKFLITVKNVDSENAITLTDAVLRILPAIDNNSAAFEQPFCVRIEGSNDDCTDLTKKTGLGNFSFDLTSAVTSELAKNNGTARFEVFVDSNVQVPANLELQVRGLGYDDETPDSYTESYMVSVK